MPTSSEWLWLWLGPELEPVPDLVELPVEELFEVVPVLELVELFVLLKAVWPGRTGGCDSGCDGDCDCRESDG